MFFSGNYSEDSRQEERRCEALFFLSWKRTVRTNNQILEKSPKGEKSCKSFQIIQIVWKSICQILTDLCDFCATAHSIRLDTSSALRAEIKYNRFKIIEHPIKEIA